MPEPLDPFEPDDDAHSDPIDEEERASLIEDLADLAEFREALEPRGFRGVVIPCPDCEEDHFFGWELLRGWTSPTEAARRIRRALTTRGLTDDEVTEVLSEGGLPAGSDLE